jgi:hypothetical protein
MTPIKIAAAMLNLVLHLSHLLETKDSLLKVLDMDIVMQLDPRMLQELDLVQRLLFQLVLKAQVDQDQLLVLLRKPISVHQVQSVLELVLPLTQLLKVQLQLEQQDQVLELH